jgi:hypothetical protein
MVLEVDKRFCGGIGSTHCGIFLSLSGRENGHRQQQ